MNMNSNEEKVADGIKDLLSGQLQLGMGSLGLVTACKSGGITKSSVASGLSRYIANGGDDALAVMGSVLSTMGAAKLKEVLQNHCPEEFIKDVDAEVHG